MHWLPVIRHARRISFGASERQSFACHGLSALAILGVAVALISIPSTTAAQAPANDPRAEDEALGDAGVYLPTDRALSRAMTRARERLATGEYQAALGFLQDVLSRDEDSFLDDSAGEKRPSGLKAAARRWIGDLPDAGREAYELLEGAAARRGLESAMETGDEQQIAQVVRKYFHTEAGYEAALLLAQIKADHGHHLAAAQLYQELGDSPAAERFEPQLSVLAALNHLAAGQTDSAREVLKHLAERHPEAALELGGRSTTVPRADRDLLAWLEQLVGRPLETTLHDQDWLTLHGDATRHTRPAGGAPHLRARWEARVVNDPGMESFLAKRSEGFAQRGIVAIPAAKPLAVGDVVLVRTPHNVVAVDWRTGKRIWETREEDGLGDVELAPADAIGFESDEFALPGNPLEKRVWDDVLAMSLGSDGERVFVIRGLSTPTADDATWQVAPFGVGAGAIASATNRLAAYDLATEGKLVWELDGQRPSGKLADAFFLGAPLSIDNLVFVLAEIRSAIYLLALDPATGDLKWQQQLMSLEQGIALDPQRRLLGITPSYAGGILVCPTSTGAVIALDVVKREFVWVYRYPRRVPSPAEVRNNWQQQLQGQSTRANDRWLDGTAVIVGDRVLVTPPESAEIHCLNLRTGALVWKHPRADALFVGGIDQGVVVLVGNDSLRAIKLADQSPAWGDKSVPLPPGALPAGQGYVSEGRLYLPLSTGAVIGVDVASGDIVNTIDTGRGEPLGNLICFRGSVISQSPTLLDKFEQLDVLSRRAEAALAANPADPTAIRELAEMKRVDGQIDEAIELFKRAHSLAPDDALVAEMLAESLLEVLRGDFTAHRDELPLLRQLIRGREQEIELLRVEAQGLESVNEYAGALDAYLRLIDITQDQLIDIEVSPTHHVRSDRWLGGRMGHLWSKATPQERVAMRERVDERRPALGSDAGIVELRQFIAYFDQFPDADQVRIELARRLVDQEYFQEAELQLLQLGASSASQSQASSAALMGELMLAAGDSERAMTYAALLGGRFREEVLFDGATGAEWGKRIAESDLGMQFTERRHWPAGRVKATVKTVVASSAPRERIHRGPAERQFGHRSLRIEQDFGLAPDITEWFVASDSTQLVGRDSLGNDKYQLSLEQVNSGRPYRDSSFIHAARLGHCLYVSLGGHVMAIETGRDGRGDAADVLWQAFPDGRLMTSRRSERRPRRAEIFHDWSGRKRLPAGAGPGLRAVGPATPRGVMVQELDELKCLDPLSGETLWSRTGLPENSELFGDDTVTVVVDIESGTGRLLGTIDGYDLGERKLPPFPWTLTCGRNVTYHSMEGDGPERRLVVRIVDVFSEQTVFERRYDSGTRLSVIEPRYIGVYDPTGTFQLINAESGDVLINQSVAASPRSHNLETTMAGDAVFAFINDQPPHTHHRPVGADFPIVNGHVYAFSLSSGEPLWPGAAVVRNRGAAVAQAKDVPVLVFVDRKAVQGAGGGSTLIRLLCIDKATGQTVYRNDELPDTAGSRLEIRAARGAAPGVTIDMSNREVHLALSEAPRPPAPPANDDLESPPLHNDRGLWGVGRKIGEVLQGAMQNPRRSNQLAPREPDGPQQDIIPAPDGENSELDDD